MQPHEFVGKWSKVNLKESAASQEHFLDLCRMLGHPTPAEADGEGTSFTFEKGATKASGGEGFADVWKKGFFAWEYKGKHKDLDAAYRQLLNYKDALENPPLMVTCDLDRFEVRTNFTNTVQRVERFSTADLSKPEKLAILRAVFFDPESLRPGLTTIALTEEAAAHFAKLADSLGKRGVEPQRAAHFITKVIFCLFAQDVGLLPTGHFSRIVERTTQRPADFVKYVSELFDAMAKGGTSVLEEIRYFNGNLFNDEDVIELTTEEIKIVAEAGKYDWGDIEPAIFGTLFERSLDPSKRSQIGAHYTHPDDIRAVVEPVLMEPLRREWEEVRGKVSELKGKLDRASGRNAQGIRQEIQKELAGFLNRISSLRVLDPACGSGNFLYISLKLLKDLERDVQFFASGISPNLPFLNEVSPTQLHGLEINPYAVELARTAVWIGYLQWYEKNGHQVARVPVLQPLDTIQQRDAILDLSDPALPQEPEWPEADVIIGNPPFLGDKKMRGELGDSYVESLRKLYVGRVPGQADLVCYWFEKAKAIVENRRAMRVGLLATQGIRGGANRRVLERIKQVGDIFWAESDRAWVVKGAAVRVSMVGFDNGTEQRRLLDGKPVAAINADLSSHSDVTQARRLAENQGVCFLGIMKAGPFDLDDSTAKEMLRAPLNANGRPNSDVVRPRLGGQDITGRPRTTWIIDFGVETTLEEAACYEMPFEYIRQKVKPLRDRNRRERMKEEWWIHGEARPGLRKAIEQLSRCIVTPEVAKYRLFVWMSTTVIPDHKLHVFARDDDYFLGVLHSRVHEAWSLAQCSWIGVGNDPSYSSSRTFETFPFPKPTAEQQEVIAAAAKVLNDLRERWLNPPGASEEDLKKRTLTNLYNARPTWLAQAHERLDNAVLDAYGWPHDIGTEELLTRLLALNLEREAA